MAKNRDFSKFPNAITVLDSGNVGIGNSNPSTTLHISTANGIRLQYPGNTGYTQFSTDGTNAYIFSGYDGERMRITSAGNVGIGTTVPSVLLDINTGALSANGYNGMRIADDASHFWFLVRKDGSGNKRFAIYNGQGATPMTLQEGGGNLGIGTTNPTSLLQVGSISGGGTGTSSPTCITMDSTFGTNSVGTNFKLKIFQDSATNRYGFGVSDSLMEIVAGNGGSIGLFTNQTQLAMRLSAGGVVTTPLQPAFTASSSSGSNVSGANVKLTAYTDVRTNIGNCYNSSTCRFTANTAGMYLFKGQAWLPPSTTVAALSIRVNGSQKAAHRMSHTGTQTNYCTLTPTLIWYLNVGDYVELFTSTDGGELHLSTGETYSNFSGVFLG